MRTILHLLLISLTLTVAKAQTLLQFSYPNNSPGKVGINSQNDIFCYSNSNYYLKTAGNSTYQVINRPNCTTNDYGCSYDSIEISNSGTLYSFNKWRGFFKSIDSGNSWAQVTPDFSNSEMPFSVYHGTQIYFKNDSLIWFNYDTLAYSYNGAISFSTNNSIQTIGSNEVSYLANSKDGEDILVNARVGSSNLLFYSNDFGNTFLPVNANFIYSYHTWNPWTLYATEYAIENSNIFFTSHNATIDTIFQVNSNGYQMINTFVNSPTDSVLDRNIWVGNGHFYLCQEIKQGNQYFFQIYKADTPTGTLNQLYSIQNAGFWYADNNQFRNYGNRQMYQTSDIIFVFEDGIASGNEKLNQLSNFTLFPNPTSNTITIKSASPTMVSIQNYLGEEVMNTYIRNQSTIDINHLAKGIYIAKSNNGNCVKLMKE